ncbi:MAG: hypothetical protein KGL39_01390 [Patescibacteria group bacterium]|nr:hypothetical protein [Patescibacteria group bacterium]
MFRLLAVASLFAAAMSDITLKQLNEILGNSGQVAGVEAFAYWETSTDQKGRTCDFYFVHIGGEYMSPRDAAAWRVRAAAEGVPVPDDANEFNNVAVLQSGLGFGAYYMYDNAGP